MSVFTMDQILETDRFVIQEMFELHTSAPELSQELQELLRVEGDSDPDLPFAINGW